ncbi:MAG: hypothetical protein JNL11_13230 [Bdellovibrionaceae bacterium]|nr:hypothetical protein [Pseudobdellovibrionaceae bacterium]
MKQLLKTSVLLLVSSVMVSCGDKSKKDETSFDQKMYTQFYSQNFSDPDDLEVSYVENKEKLDGMSFKKDGTVKVKVSFTNGYYRASVPNRLYITMEEYLKDAAAIATKDLTPTDSKEAWDKAEKQGLAEAKQQLIHLKCSLVVSGKNLTPLADATVIRSNGYGQIADLEFDVVDVLGVPTESDKSKSIPSDYHASVCKKENIKAVQDKQAQIKKDNEFTVFEAKFKFMRWFIFTEGENFIVSKKAKLSFNSMDSNEIRNSETVFSRIK